MDAGPKLLLGIALLCAIFLAILWALMPFLLLGTNRRLDTTIQQNLQIINLLEQLTKLP